MVFPQRLDLCRSKLKGVVSDRVNFWNRHVRDTVVILEEVTPPHPRYPLCDMMVPWKALNGAQ